MNETVSALWIVLAMLLGGTVGMWVSLTLVDRWAGDNRSPFFVAAVAFAVLFPLTLAVAFVPVLIWGK